MPCLHKFGDRQSAHSGHKKRKIAKPTNRAKLPELIIGPDLAGVEVKSQIFAHITFCALCRFFCYVFEVDQRTVVIDGLPKCDKKALEKLVYANGGRFIQGIPTVQPRRIISRVDKCALAFIAVDVEQGR